MPRARAVLLLALTVFSTLLSRACAAAETVWVEGEAAGANTVTPLKDE